MMQSLSTTKLMKNYLRVAVPSHIYQLLDYLIPDAWEIGQLQPGMRVRVPLGKKQHVGIIMAISDHSEHPTNKLKYVETLLDNYPVLPSDIIKLAQWASDYYHYPIGEVVTKILPRLLREGESTDHQDYQPRKKSKASEFIAQEFHDLNQEQQTAVDTIMQYQNQFQVFLLEGVTGSGKTEVYFHCIDQILKQQKQILVLVPEIGLTPQIVKRFEDRFHVPTAIIHSKLSDRERCYAWLKASKAEATILIGTRSAAFTPMPNLGMIIIDEAHDLSFKQQDHFRYSARDLAVMRAQFDNIPIVLGSATPSFESLHNAAQKRYQHLLLTQRAGDAKKPQYQIIDIRNQKLQHGMSNQLLDLLETHLQQDNQVLIFLNRRGYAPILICHACGWIAKCKRCDANMTLHWSPKTLHCHHCDSMRGWDTTCPECANHQLMPVGMGTERIEQFLQEKFGDKSIVRIDRDTVKGKYAMQKLLDQIDKGQHQILIGTQMLAKGHHFPNVTLVAIIDADGGFFSADFRATERMAQLLIQVSGRAGRADKPGMVALQTRNPDHSLIQCLLQQGYHSFAQIAINTRKTANLPPFSYLALLRAEAINPQYPKNFLIQVNQLAQQFLHDGVNILGPIAAPMEKRGGRFRAHLLFQSNQRKSLHHLLNQLIPQLTKMSNAKVRWSLDVDPQEVY